MYLKKNAGRRRKEREDSSKGIWLVLIWKYCFTSSELNYWSELGVLGKQAACHTGPDGQGVVCRSVTVAMVSTRTPSDPSSGGSLLGITSKVVIYAGLYSELLSLVFGDFELYTANVLGGFEELL